MRRTRQHLPRRSLTARVPLPLAPVLMPPRPLPQVRPLGEASSPRRRSFGETKACDEASRQEGESSGEFCSTRPGTSGADG